jgi:Flp pilus assembly protein TadD
MDMTDRLPRTFARSRLPWLVAAAALLLYLVTLNRWLQLTSLPLVARVAGWDPSPNLSAPVWFLLTLPARLLSGAALPVALNVLTALLAAATLALLARSVALLPYDRTREARQRERSEQALLSIPLAWVGPVLAVLLCGLQLTFWEHATVATGEMLDLLLFAVPVWCLLEYRISQREGWLTALAFLYGLAVTNNHAMIAFFPCFLIALIWVKGFGFFNPGFLARMLGAGLAGLLLYLVLPAVAVWTQSREEAGFWTYLRSQLAAQKAALGSVPPFAILLVSLSTVLPVFVLGIRWQRAVDDTSRAGVAMANFITRFVHVVMLAAAASVFLDPVWSPRALGFGRPMLPFYYLAALAAGYYAGYLLLVARDPAGRAAYLVTPGARFLGRALAAATLVAAAALPVTLAARNGPLVAALKGRDLARLADRLVDALPAQNAYVLSDDQSDLLLLEAGLARRGAAGAHVLLWSRLMPYRLYQQQLHDRYGNRWSWGASRDLPDLIAPESLARLVESVAASNQLFYLRPSFGYYFERVELRPAGLVFRLQPRPAEPAAAPALSAEDLNRGEAYWEGLRADLESLPPADRTAPLERRYVNAFYARALASWSALVQRAGQPDRARRWAELALRLNPANRAAKLTLALNDLLRAKAALPAPDGELTDELKGWLSQIDRLLLEDGLFDHPQLSYHQALLYMQSAYFRQALDEFRRLRTLRPEDENLQVWEQTALALDRFAGGDVAGAEKQLLELRTRHPRRLNVLEALRQVYQATERLTNALETLQAQLAVEPENESVLLNLAALHIQMKDYAGALPPLNKLLAKNPRNAAALLNRAIAQLQAGRLDEARQDYEALRALVPESYAVYYGLGEIAWRKQDKAAALRHFETYLKYGIPGSEEYKAVAERVRQLKSGGA